MLYNNKKFLSLLKKIQLFSGISLLLAMTAAILLEHFVLVFYLGVVLMLMLILTRVLNFNFVRFQLENEKLIIRYYSLYSVDRNYESIEFPVHSLRKVIVKKYLFGLKWDLRLTVKLKQGMADYPAVCLSAVPFEERQKIVKEIRELVR
jgi:hypothetical protein